MSGLFSKTNLLRGSRIKSFPMGISLCSHIIKPRFELARWNANTIKWWMDEKKGTQMKWRPMTNAVIVLIHYPIEHSCAFAGVCLIVFLFSSKNSRSSSILVIVGIFPWRFVKCALHCYGVLIIFSLIALMSFVHCFPCFPTDQHSYRIQVVTFLFQSCSAGLCAVLFRPCLTCGFLLLLLFSIWFCIVLCVLCLLRLSKNKKQDVAKCKNIQTTICFCCCPRSMGMRLDFVNNNNNSNFIYANFGSSL